MANIALRDYNQEIEAMINDDRFDEAIAHCLHILKLYPKHITTYRQLGNAFLEAKRYDDALDIFQRLLSAVPDDFIANLGMSIIREDEGNLDAAIWYMERAFEQKPSNKAIQEELRRLYGRRDRVEPSKIRLTRGALAQMYAKGDQIPQAIAEINAALSEDTQRPDLQILLASVYHQAGKDDEASETCRALLDKLPDCLVANYILAEILEKSGKVDEAKPYREKLQAMEPYEVKVSPQAPVADQVPADAIIIPKLDITDDQISKAISQPAWAASLGIVASDLLSGQEEIPEWMASIEKQEKVQEEAEELPGLPASQEKEAPQAEPIPDWMKETGWSPATGAVEEGPAPVEETAISSEQEEQPAQDEIPDWMRSITPEGVLDEMPSGEELEEDKNLAAILSESQPSKTTEASKGTLPVESIPEWLQGLGGEETPSAAESPAVPEAAQPMPDEETPGQIPVEAESAAGVNPPSYLNETQPGPSGTIGTWLSDKLPPANEQVEQPGEEKPVFEPAEGIPEWLRDFAEEETPAAAAPVEPAPTAPSEEIPAWLSDFTKEEVSETGAEQEKVEEGQGVPEEELPDWLRDYTEKMPSTPHPGPTEAATPEAAPTAEVPSEPVLTPQTAAEEELPEWLRSFAEEEVLAAEVPSEPVPAPQASGGEELPEWLRGLAEEEIPVAETQAETVIEPQPAVEEVPEWLSSSTEEEATPTEAAAQPIEATTPEEELPDWLSSFIEEKAPAAEIPTEPEAEIPAEQPVTATPEEVSVVSAEIAPVEAPGATEFESPPDFEDLEKMAGAQAPQTTEPATEAVEMEGAISPETPDFAQGLPVIEQVAKEQAELPTEVVEEQVEIIKPPLATELSGRVQKLETALGGWIPESEISGLAGETPPMPEEEALPPPSIEPEAEQPVTSEEYAWTAPALAEEQQITATTAPIVPLEPIPAEAGITTQRININTATLVELERLPGVGFRLAQNIINYRQTQGTFEKLEDLVSILNVPLETFNIIRAYLTVEAPRETPAPQPVAYVAEQVPIELKDTLERARAAIQQDQISAALEDYQHLIKSKVLLEEVIQDLTQALMRHPDELPLLQALGDAYLRCDRLQEAMDAYTRAERLIK